MIYHCLLCLLLEGMIIHLLDQQYDQQFIGRHAISFYSLVVMHFTVLSLFRRRDGIVSKCATSRRLILP